MRDGSETEGRRLLRVLLLRRYAVSSGSGERQELLRLVGNSPAGPRALASLYGHNRLRELILGGASKTMLNQETLTPLVSR